MQAVLLPTTPAANKQIARLLLKESREKRWNILQQRRKEKKTLSKKEEGQTHCCLLRYSLHIWIITAQQGRIQSAFANIFLDAQYASAKLGITALVMKFYGETNTI